MLSPLHSQTRDLVGRYLDIFPQEGSTLTRLCSQLDDPVDCFVRSNMTGHVTTSAAVLSPDGQQVLLIHHKFLDKWLPPGGHYERPDGLWESAMREVEEETGVRGLVLHPWSLEHQVPFDIDTHSMPANAAKDEGPHWHHDFRYLAVAPNADDLVPQLAEVHAARWAPLAELATSNDRRLTTLARKLQTLL